MIRPNFGRIGGTCVSAIVGQNPWKNAHGAYLELRQEVSPTPDNVAMERGRRYEPVVADIFAGGRQEYLVKHNRKDTDEPELFVHPEYEYLIGHPDRLLYDSNSQELVAGLEIKTSNISNCRKWGEEGTDDIPIHYLIQCQWYAGLANLPLWRVAVAFLDDFGRMKTYKEYAVHADKELFETLVDSAVTFWESHVVPGVPPIVDDVDSVTERWVAERFPRNLEPLATATPDEENAMADYLRNKTLYEQAQANLQASETALKMAIGDRDGLVSEKFGKVTWKKSKDSSRTDYKAICSELNPSQELVNKYTKNVEGSRRFVSSLKSA